MKIVNRVRLAFFAVLLVGHALTAMMVPEYQADLTVVLLGINATVMLILAPFLVDRLLLNDLRVLETFINEVKMGRTGPLPVPNKSGEDHEEGEFIRLRRSLNWMARQIQMREERINREVERVRQLNVDLERLSVTDPLTGLYNHGFFWKQISASSSLLRRKSQPFSLVVADIDFFKKVNDTYGHPAGDMVLRGIAAVLKAHVRDTDVLARIGGEEFAIILNGSTADDAVALLNRLQENIRKTPFVTDDGRCLRVTMSMGFVSVNGTKMISPEEVVRHADDALYFVKRHGRNGIKNWAQISGA